MKWVKRLIELVGLKKTYKTSEGNVNALNGISLKINDSDIFGVVGFSGAGKSTLVRCINLLECPDSGSVLIDGTDITTLPQKELEHTRQKIGMIFQHFNLLHSKTVFENIAFPLKYLHKSKEEIKQKVTELLELVDLAGKADSYPSQLSGGQKQRVAIARALANDPQILLSDEATSALDPQTTDSILQLLRRLNEKLGLTIVLITHEMYVIKEVCTKVAVMENGVIVEQGNTFDVFSNPKTDITKRFTGSTFKFDCLEKLIRSDHNLVTAENGKLMHLTFIGENANKSYIAEAIRRFDTDISIIYGSIEIIQSKPIGSLWVRVSGNADQINDTVDYFKSADIRVKMIDPDNKEVVR